MREQEDLTANQGDGDGTGATKMAREGKGASIRQLLIPNFPYLTLNVNTTYLRAGYMHPSGPPPDLSGSEPIKRDRRFRSGQLNARH